MEQSNFKRFLLLWMGELISAIGGGLTSFGLGVYVFEKTGSGLVSLAGSARYLVSPVIAGKQSRFLLKRAYGQDRKQFVQGEVCFYWC